MTMTIQEYAQQNNIREGATVAGLGRTQVAYTIAQVDSKGFTLARPSGKQVRVTWRMVQETWGRLQAGEQVRFQGNRSRGGVDGTSAKRDGVLAALRGLALRDGDLVQVAEGAAARLAG